MQGLRQYWWNLFVNGFLMSYLFQLAFVASYSTSWVRRSREYYMDIALY